MKKIFIIFIALFTTQSIFSQLLSHIDIAELFSIEDNNGTARFNAMGGAFASLGGDLSAIDQNPAGASVFLDSEIALTLNSVTKETKASYYNAVNLNDYSIGENGQLGAVFVFNKRKSKRRRVAIGYNKTVTHNFSNDWIATGNSGFSPALQSFENNLLGRVIKRAFSFASIYKNFHFGLSINSHDVNFSQNVFLEEPVNGVNTSYQDYLQTSGDGNSLSIGIIGDFAPIRLGLAYHSPTRYNLTEEFEGERGLSYYNFSLKTPRKWVAGASFLAGKKGLLSISLEHKDFSDVRLGGSFSSENADISSLFSSRVKLSIGGEWRIQRLSLRGGYFYENSKKVADVSAASIGFGYKFGNLIFDASYQQYATKKGIYHLDDLTNSVSLNSSNSKLAFTLALKF